MLKVDEAVVVEGKYDKIKLSNILDAFIIETNGFGIYKDKDRLNFIKKLAKERGLIIITDSDAAGCQIRNYISAGIEKENIKNIYIPTVRGKEKRKKAPSKAGLIGTEGISDSQLLKLFENAGVKAQKTDAKERIKNADLYEMGFSGRYGSAEKRKKLLTELELPEFLSTSALLSYVNYNFTKEEFTKYVAGIKDAG